MRPMLTLVLPEPDRAAPMITARALMGGLAGWRRQGSWSGPAAEPALVGGVVERAVAEPSAARPGPTKISAVRSIGSRATAAAIVPSVPRTMRSSGQLARATIATGQSAP